ncbi:unnamed protein product [Moneuplotes crassus]|uniref:Uncharacterized protein n=1 Tax=Euplotes crassus TaxID=5936 RepID=A0AAD1XQW0_EUPCR|nr:unnamed protein product [Moneuplotes crassus]
MRNTFFVCILLQLVICCILATTSPPQPRANRNPSSLPNKRPFPLSTLNHDLILEFALQDIKSSSQKHVQNANTHIFQPLSSSAKSSSKTTSKPFEKPAAEEFCRTQESKIGAPLDFTKVWSFEVLGIKVLLQLQFILKMGWFVVQGEARENGYQVTYIPFLLGYSYLWTDVDAGISKFYIDPNFQYVWMYVPVDVVLTSERICMKAVYNLAPMHFYVELNPFLKECKFEIFDEILSEEPLNSECNDVKNLTAVVANTHLSPGHSQLLFDMCVNF